MGNANTARVIRGGGRRPGWLATAAALAALTAAGVGLRLPVWAWGLPREAGGPYFSYHPDEVFLLLPSFGFAQGDWNPHFFNYGTLYIYLVGLATMVFRPGALQPGVGPWMAQLPTLYAVGRTVTLALGMGTVWALFLFLRQGGPGQALLAGLLLAICPLHVVNSGYATVDVPATFWLVLAFGLAQRQMARPTSLGAALAGLAVGLGAATKYSAGLFLLPVLGALLLTKAARVGWRWAAAAVAGAAAGFAMGCPYFWTEEGIRGMLFEARHAAAGGTTAFAGMGTGWGYHLLHGLPTGLGYPLLGAVLLGAAAAVAEPSPAHRFSLAWAGFYLVVIGFGKERFVRYLVPLTPFLCVLAAGGLQWVVRLPTRRWARAAAVGVAGALVVLTLGYAMAQVARYTGPDPRDEAGASVRLAAPHQGLGGPAGIRMGLVQAPWYFHPPVSPYNAGPFSARWFWEWNREKGNPVVVTGWDEQALERERPEVFFLSDLECQDLVRLGDPAVLRFLKALTSHYRTRTIFARPVPRLAWLGPPRAWAPPDWRYPDPVITMYHGLREQEE